MADRKALCLASGRLEEISTADRLVLPGDPLTELHAVPKQYVDRSNGNALAVGEEVYTRERADSSTGVVNTQALRLAYFTARKPQTTTKVRVRSGTTAAGATPTLCRVGLYLIDGAGDGTRVASILNDTSLFNLASTGFARDWSVPYLMVVGQRYALGILIVTTAATPTLCGYTYATSMDEEGAVSPRLTGRLNSQTDLPALFTDASLVTTINRYYGVILP